MIKLVLNVRRVLVLDTNQQRVVGVSEEGIFTSQLEVGYKYRVFWPHQIMCFQSAPSAATDLPSADVYVSEFLGKCLCVLLLCVVYTSTVKTASICSRTTYWMC